MGVLQHLAGLGWVEMSRRRPPRDAALRRGADATDDHLSLSAWGLQPQQWRPVGSMAIVGARAVLLWRIDGASPADDVALQARRAYDRLGELGTTVAADSTVRGIEITVPLSRVELALRILIQLGVCPDAVLVDDPPAAKLRELRRMIGALRRDVELVIGETGGRDPVADLRARVRAG